MELKKDPWLFALAALVLLGVGFLVYTHRISWEIGTAFLALYVLPSVFGRKPDAKVLVLALALSLTACPKAAEEPGIVEKRAKNAIDLAGYQQALDACRKEAVAAKDMAVFDRCAEDAGRRYGKDAGQ